MFTLPKPRRALPWAEQVSVRLWLTQIFKLASRKRDYHVTVGKSPHYAWVNPESRRVYVTNELPTVAPDHIRFDPVDAHRRTEMMLNGFMSHEAAHVRFSGPKPAGKLGEIWNALEDERIERLIALEFPELHAIFTFLGDVVTEADRSRWSFTAMEGTLQWRFEHDRHTPRWRPREEDAEIWEREIRPRVELAWRAEDSGQVTQLAAEIQTLLREHQQGLEPPKQAAPPPPDQPAALPPPEDGGSQEPCSPGDAGEGEAGKSQSTPEDENGEAKPGEAGESQDTPGDEDAQEDAGGAGESQDTPEDENGEAESGEAGESQDTPKDENGEAESGEAGENQDTPEDAAAEEDASGAGEAAQDTPGDVQDAPADSGEGDGGGPAGKGQTGPRSNASAEQQAAENGDDEYVPETWNNLSATGADADERDGDAQAQRDASEQAQDAGAQKPERDPAQPNAGSGGRGVSTEDTPLPAMPDADPGSADVTAEGVEGHARRLAPLLKPPERPGRTRPHRSKGRYDARRDARDAERVFMRKTVPSRPMPIRVRLLIDISGSMSGAPLECARAAASMVIRAAALSGSGAEVHLFNTHHQPVITTPMPYTEAQALVAGISASGSTRLAPALAILTCTPPNPLESELIVVVCDGQLTGADYAECALTVKRGQAVGKRYLPVLISEAAASHGQWREVFGSALPCESVTDLAVNLKAALTTLRGHLGG